MSLKLLLCYLLLPFMLTAQGLRDSQQELVFLGEEEVRAKSQSMTVFRPDFNHTSPFHCLSLAWNELNSNSLPELHFRILVSVDSLNWTEAGELHYDEHAEDIRDQFASSLLIYETRYRFVRVSWVDGRGRPAVSLRNLRLNFFSPGTEPGGEFARETSREKASCACPQPAFRSRQDWRCPQGPTSPSTTTVTHLVVHHSAGTNVSNDWGAIVLAIWNLHVYTNGWADVGYNWLISPDGTLFEGRGGGDNVLGAHFCSKNSGTMGVCLIGTYTSVQPSDAAMARLADILTWKACQRAVLPSVQTLHAATGFQLFGISGHRDGCATECPGQRVYDRLTELRSDVEKRLLACSATPVMELPPGITMVQVWPNPAPNREAAMEIHCKESIELSFHVLDSKGSLVSERQVSLPPGLHILPIEGLIKLPSGFYPVHIRVGNHTTSRLLSLP